MSEKRPDSGQPLGKDCCWTYGMGRIVLDHLLFMVGKRTVGMTSLLTDSEEFQKARQHRSGCYRANWHLWCAFPGISCEMGYVSTRSMKDEISASLTLFSSKNRILNVLSFTPRFPSPHQPPWKLFLSRSAALLFPCSTTHTQPLRPLLSPLLQFSRFEN